jgi:hypothetical protein
LESAPIAWEVNEHGEGDARPFGGVILALFLALVGVATALYLTLA